MKHGFASESEREFVWRDSFVTRKPTQLTGAADVSHNRAMKDLTSVAWIKFKGLLFLFLGAAAATLLILENPTWRTAGLLALAIWSFCRAYYFAFYVIEKYVDPSYKFSGLGSFVKYLFTQPQK
jgi:hypothetical protein